MHSKYRKEAVIYWYTIVQTSGYGEKYEPIDGC